MKYILIIVPNYAYKAEIWYSTESSTKNSSSLHAMISPLLNTYRLVYLKGVQPWSYRSDKIKFLKRLQWDHCILLNPPSMVWDVEAVRGQMKRSLLLLLFIEFARNWQIFWNANPFVFAPKLFPCGFLFL